MITSAVKFRWGVLIAFLALLVARPASASLDYFVQIATIGGESTAQNHEGWIVALAVSSSVQKQVAVTHSGVVAQGVTQFAEVSITKALDKASPKLAEAVAAGTALGNVTLDVVEHGSGLPVYHIILRNVLATSHALMGDSEQVVEYFSLVYDAIEWTYTYQAGPQFMGYWDQITVMGGPGPLPTPTPAAQQDSDSDGMPDSYEIANGLNPFFNDANGDKDGDGASNISEYRAGTLANDANSVFRVHGISKGNGTMLITWSSVANKTYSITESATPNGTFTAVQSGILSFEGETSRNVPFTGTNLFFKVTTP